MRSSTAARTSVLLTSVVLVAGCGSSVTADSSAPPSGTPGEGVTIDNCGREILVAEPPTAAVGLSPGPTELLLRLGLADLLVGQAQTQSAPLPDDVAELASDVPVLGQAAPPAREDLLAVEPDFVFSPTTYEFTAEQGFASLEQLDEAGVTAYVATGGCAERRMEGTVEDVLVDIENLGEIFGVREEAAALVERGRADLDEVDERIREAERPTVAQVYVEGRTLSAIGAGIEYDMIHRAGGDNVFSPDDEAFSNFFAAQITPEVLAAENPDALVFKVSGPEQEEATASYLTSTFPEMTAVREGRLIAINSADTMPGTLGNIEVVRAIAEALHPEAFSS
ncbi:ABC transporter substrate-binding protein [Actinoalloteichus spitiensis]|uniref:ABC transporter substrate-binding protein n=1 Tax=Actinoalloteichus spitiensis TaxID=252394 RepID=UPI000365A544|nr:ABC transporter substrate-binding protein [Actinoalloteichus spitiensis]